MPSELWAKVSAPPSYRAEEGFDGLDVRCYLDNFGSSERQCIPEVAEANGITTISIAAEDLGDDDVTLDIRFEEDAVAHAGALGALSVWQIVAAAVFLALTVLAAWLIWRRWRGRRNPMEAAEGPVITRYRSDIPPLLAGILLRQGHEPDHQKTFAASILFAAVRGAIVLEAKDHRTTVRLEGSVSDLPAESRRFLHRVLHLSDYGDTRTIYSSDYGMSKRWRTLVGDEQERAQTDGLVGHSAVAARADWQLATVLGLVVASYIWVFFAWGHVSEDLMALPLVGFFIGIAALLGLTFAVSAARNAIGLTPEGQQMQQELLGLQQYITLAEQDRLEMLQGAETAQRTPTGEIAGQEVLEVYESLLPYAELFGLTKSWAQQLEVRYREDDHSPVWVPDIDSVNLTLTLNTVRAAAAVRTPPETGGWGSSDSSYSSSSFSGGGSAGGGFGGGSVGGR